MEDILPPKDRRESEPTVTTTVRVPQTLRDGLLAAAKKSGYKLSEVIIRFLWFGLRHWQEQQRKKERP